MNADLEQVLSAALVALAGWLVKDFAFALIQKRNELERREWEYRLKEVFCPLYFWSGLLAMRTQRERTHEICDRLDEVMARAAYVVPKLHYYTLVKLLQSAHNQDTTPATVDDRDSMRDYLYRQVEALNFLLYRSEGTYGVGDPRAVLSPNKRLLRLLMVGATNLLLWIIAALAVAGGLWLYEHRYFDFLGGVGVVFLVLLWIDIRRRATVRDGLEERV